MNITGHSVEKLEDPTGILVGDRYEFFLDTEVPEDDDLYSELGLVLRVIFLEEEADSRIVQYQIIEKTTEKIFDFELDEDELEYIKKYCEENVK